MASQARIRPPLKVPSRTQDLISMEAEAQATTNNLPSKISKKARVNKTLAKMGTKRQTKKRVLQVVSQRNNKTVQSRKVQTIKRAQVKLRRLRASPTQ